MLYIWLLLPATVVGPLVFNVVRWRRDLQRIRQLSASRRKLSFPPDDSAHRVSFLIAAWNEESALQPSLDAILSLGCPDFEIVLCAGGTDRTWQIATDFARQAGASRFILLRQEAGEGKQKSLAKCLENSSGRIIYLLDAGCRITAQAFARMLHAIVEDGEQAVTAFPCVPLPAQMRDSFVASQCSVRVYTSLYQPDYCSGLLGANSAIRRTALEQAGGFAGEIRTGVDYDLGKRLLGTGFRIHYDPHAAFPSQFRTEIRSYLRQQSRWLRNVVIHGARLRQYREAISCLATSLVGLAMLLVPLAIIAATRFPRIPVAVAALLAAAWVVAFFTAFFSRMRYLKVAALWLGVRWPPHTIALVPIFIFIDFLAWSIPLFEYPSKARRERW